MRPELAEEASVDTAMSRTPTAILSMEIDAQGSPAQLQIKDSSLPEWGEYAARIIRQWRFTAATQEDKALPVSCVVELE